MYLSDCDESVTAPTDRFRGHFREIGMCKEFRIVMFVVCKHFVFGFIVAVEMFTKIYLGFNNIEWNFDCTVLICSECLIPFR